eukprot:6148386-Prymnesium_polylepis.3
MPLCTKCTRCQSYLGVLANKSRQHSRPACSAHETHFHHTSISAKPSASVCALRARSFVPNPNRGPALIFEAARLLIAHAILEVGRLPLGRAAVSRRLEGGLEQRVERQEPLCAHTASTHIHAVNKACLQIATKAHSAHTRRLHSLRGLSEGCGRSCNERQQVCAERRHVGATDARLRRVARDGLQQHAPLLDGQVGVDAEDVAHRPDGEELLLERAAMLAVWRGVRRVAIRNGPCAIDVFTQLLVDTSSSAPKGAGEHTCASGSPAGRATRTCPAPSSRPSPCATQRAGVRGPCVRSIMNAEEAEE